MQIYKIHIGFIEIPSKVSLNIYVKGCKFKCKNCHTPQLQSFDKKNSTKLTDIDLHNYLLKYKGLIDGICWLGGDAIFQTQRLIQLSKIIKKENLYSVLYTGKVFENIIDDVKDNLDGIIDGQYNGYSIGHAKCNQRIFGKVSNNWQQFETLKEFSNKTLN